MSSENKLIYFLEVSCLTLLLMYASMIYLDQQLVDSFFNSDWVMFFQFFNDLFLNHGHYKDWVISPAPHFFPDMFIFFPFFFLVRNIYFQFLIVIWLMISLNYLSIRIIYSHFFSKQTRILFSLAATCSLFLLAFKKESPYILALLPAVHIGEFIIGLFLIGIHLTLIEHNKLDYKSYLLSVVSAVIAFAAGISDLLFVVQFACPIFLAYNFLWIKKRIKFHLAMIFSSPVVLCAILGGAITKFLVPKDILLDYLAHSSITKITFKGLIIQLFAVVKVIENINNHEVEMILGIFYFLILSILMISIINFNEKVKVYVNNKIIFLCFFILSSILTNVVSFFFFANPGDVHDRYLITFYYLPFLMFFLPFSCFKEYQIIYKIMIGLSFLIFFYILKNMYLLSHKPGFKLHMSYYPPEIRCIDDALCGYGHNGIAQYWDANYLTSLSKENLQIVPVNPNLTPFYWSINVRKFETPISFVILGSSLTSLNKDIIYGKFGTPKKEIICYAKRILIYPENSIKLASKVLST